MAAATPSSDLPPGLLPLPAEGCPSARICLTTFVALVSASPPAGAPASPPPPPTELPYLSPIRLYASSPPAARTPLLAASQAPCLHISETSANS